MEIEQAIYERLTADTPLSLLVADRIYPVQAVQGDTLPLVVYEQASRKQLWSLTGPIQLNAYSLHVDCYATSYAAVKAVARAVRDCLNGFAGSLASGAIRVLGIFDENADDGLESPAHADEFGIHRAGLDLNIHYGEES